MISIMLPEAGHACEQPVLAAWLSEELGRPVRLALACAGEGLQQYFRPDEEACWRARSLHRQNEWFASRAAMQLLLPAERRASAQTFPAADISLSHSGDFAAAIWVQHGTGCGIDLEMPRQVKSGIGSHFLTKDELAALKPNRDLLRLWTIKEAIFKADLQNQNRLLLHYQLHDLEADCGTASRLDDAGNGFDYAACVLQNQIQIAVAVRENNKVG